MVVWDDHVLVVGEATVVAVTSRAILCEAVMLSDLEEKERWIPFSQLDFTSEINMHAKVGDVGTLIISQWIAKKKGLV